MGALVQAGDRGHTGDKYSQKEDTSRCENGGAKLDHGGGGEVLLRAA